MTFFVIYWRVLAASRKYPTTHPIKLHPKFIITRFCHGAGGKFFSTVLQSHPRVQHWTHWLQKNKTSAEFHRLARVHAQRSFPKNHAYHLRAEPIAPYDTSLWSSTHDRGQDLELSDLQKYYDRTPDRYLASGINQNLWTNLIFNKILLPKFCANSKIVTLVVDSVRSLSWVQKSLWQKHFIECDDKIIYCPNHPLYCPEESVITVLKYNNPCEFPVDQKQTLFQQHIADNPLIKNFSDLKNFQDHEDHHIIPISALFDQDQLLQHLDAISEKWRWERFDADVVSTIHQCWIGAQITY